LKFAVTDEEKKLLLANAREAVSAELEKRSPRYGQDSEPDKKYGGVLLQKCGAFVTLHEETASGRTLRGCIGRIVSDDPLVKTVRSMAIEAAFGDPRFPPLAKSEWAHCDIEISALSPMEPCAGPRSVRVGVHGLYLLWQGSAGVFLPQVPVELGWNLDQYLDGICRKAGLPSGAYKAEGARLYTFTATVFGEPALNPPS
jgi:AmmeMemoRadiSam system protein A